MISKNTKDIFFTDDGDLFFDEYKRDFHLAGIERNEILETTILRRLNSSQREWDTPLGNHASLDDFIGVRVEQSLTFLIKERILDTLTRDGFLKRSEILIESSGLTSNTVILYINILKSFEGSEGLNFKLFYNSRNNKIKAFKYNIAS